MPNQNVSLGGFHVLPFGVVSFFSEGPDDVVQHRRYVQIGGLNGGLTHLFKFLEPNFLLL